MMMSRGRLRRKALGVAFGVIAALGWAFFVPAQAYSVVLMPTAWFVFIFWFVVWRIVRKNATLSALEFFLLALLIGLTATAVATVLAIVPLLIAALFRFKAGALHEGLQVAKGEFVAIFDADFVPPPDFLLRIVHHFPGYSLPMVNNSALPA